MKKFVFFIITIPLILLCTHTESPFSDHSNAKIHYIAERSTFNDSGHDSASVFSTETLTVAATVCELIDSFSIRIEKNRLWNRLVVIQPTSDYYIFPVSFYDTGKQTIEIITYRANNDRQIQEISLLARNQLFQPDIPEHALADTLTLAARGAGDKNGIMYNWEFGTGGQLIQSPYTTVRTSITSVNNIESDGTFWISDSLYQSPKVTFKYTFIDTTPPVILCMNEHFNPVTKRIKTSDSIFSFMVRVTDRGNQAVGNVTINDQPPDFKRLNVYTKIVKNIHLYTPENPIYMTVYAIDNSAFGNDTTETFAIEFDKSAVRRGVTSIKIESFSGNELLTARNAISVYGTIENSDNHFVNVEFILNDNPVKDTVIRGYGQWNTMLSLSEGTNSFRIRALDTNDYILDSAFVPIYYSKNIEDTTTPVITSIEIDTQLVDNDIYYTEKDSARIVINAFDAGSGIQRVIFRSDTRQDTIIMPENAYRAVYTLRSLQHKVNNLFVNVIDVRGNSKLDTLLLIKNAPPIYSMNKTIPYVVFIGQKYSDTIKWYDADNDAITFTVSGQPESMHIDNNGVITWIPDATDITDELSFQIKDGFKSVRGYYQFAIIDPAAMFPVITISDSSEIPLFLEAGKDSLDFIIKTIEHTGNRPFNYTARIINRNISILDMSRDSTVRWKPTESDTGIIELQLITEDSLKFSDTLYRSITILRPNNDKVRLQWSTDATLYQGNSILLSNPSDTEIVAFKIIDNDDPRTEKHILTITLNAQKSTFPIAGDTFSIKLSPLSNKLTDTLSVIIFDMSKTSDTVIIPIIYGRSPNYFSGLYSWFTQSGFSYFANKGAQIESWTGSGNYPFSFNNFFTGSAIYTKENAINNYLSVNFNSKNDYLANTTEGTLFNDTLTVYVLARYDSTTIGSEYLTLLSSCENGDNSFGAVPGTAYTGFGISRDGKLAVYSKPSYQGIIANKRSKLALPQKQWNILSYSTTGISGPSIDVVVSLDNQIDTLKNIPAYNQSFLTLGNCLTGNGTMVLPWFGDIAEVIIYNRLLTADERTGLELYLKNKYNL